MIKNLFKYLLLLLSLLVIQKSTNAQFSTLESFGAKSNSLATVSTIFKDINAAYTNQAGLAFMSGLEGNLSYENRFLVLDLSAMNFAIAKRFGNLGSFGLCIKRFGISEFNEMLLGLSYARKINSSTGIGIQINAYNLNIENYGNKNAISFEAGILHDFSKRISLGFHVSNPFPIKYTADTDIPTIVSIGAKYNISGNIQLFGEVEKHINYGFFLKTAIEYRPLSIFAIYLGFKNDLSGYADYSMGAMYAATANIKINFGTSYNITLGLSPSIGISYTSSKELL